jgi:hypothetical protein
LRFRRHRPRRRPQLLYRATFVVPAIGFHVPRSPASAPSLTAGSRMKRPLPHQGAKAPRFADSLEPAQAHVSNWHSHRNPSPPPVNSPIL